MKANYRRHHQEHSQGHICLEKEGAFVINLVGAASMTQAELDFYGKIIEKAFSSLTPAQDKKARSFKRRKGYSD